MADYTTVAAVKSYLRITGSADDSLLGDLVTRASRVIDSYTGRWFDVRTETRIYDAHGSHLVGRLLLLDADLLTVTDITNGDGSSISTSDVILRPNNYPPYFGVSLKQSSGAHWTYNDDPQAAISISGTWGYASSVPEPVAQAAVRLAAYLYRQRDVANPPQLASALIPAAIQQLLTPYIRVRVKVLG